MRERSTNPDSAPLTRAYEAAHEAVTRAVELYRAVVHKEILDPDYYTGREIGPVGTTYHSWVAAAFAILWNSIPEYQQTLEAASPQLNAVREGTFKGWRGKPYANAHEACIDLAVVLCDEMWGCITAVSVDLSSGVRPRFEDWDVITRAVKHREAKLRKGFADLSDPGDIGPELLAAARIERDKALSALQKSAPPIPKCPDSDSREAYGTTQGGRQP